MNTCHSWFHIMLVCLPVFLNVTAMFSGQQTMDVVFSMYDGKANVSKKYTLGAELGKGAYASVIHARAQKARKFLFFKLQPKLLENVALKVLSSGDDDAVASLKLEYDISQKLHNENKTPVDGIGFVNGHGFMEVEVEGHKFNVGVSEMELIGDWSFEDYMKAHVGDNPNQKRYIALKFVEAMFPVLRYIHSKGITHKDLKPSNVIVKAKGADKMGWPEKFVLVDFGVGEIEVGIAKGNEDFVQVVVVVYMVLAGVPQSEVSTSTLPKQLDDILRDKVDGQAKDPELLLFLQQLLVHSSLSGPKLPDDKYREFITDYKRFITKYSALMEQGSASSKF